MSILHTNLFCEERARIKQTESIDNIVMTITTNQNI